MTVSVIMDSAVGRYHIPWNHGTYF